MGTLLYGNRSVYVVILSFCVFIHFLFCSTISYFETRLHFSSSILLLRKSSGCAKFQPDVPKFQYIFPPHSCTDSSAILWHNLRLQSAPLALIHLDEIPVSSRR